MKHRNKPKTSVLKFRTEGDWLIGEEYHGETRGQEVARLWKGVVINGNAVDFAAFCEMVDQMFVATHPERTGRPRL